MPDLTRRETPLTRRYLRILENWIPVGLRYYAEWPDRPRCGHFLGGCHWYGIETVAGAEAFAAAASSPELDEARIGCSRAELREIALRAVRYLCFTHDTGPDDCVRPAQGLGRPENCGTKWGERGLGFFRESQCGSTVAGLGLVALLLGDQVDDETRDMLRAVHADYGERFGAMPPRSGVYFDTQMEENGWTAFGLASVACVLHDDPRAEEWARATRQWMLATATAPQDARDWGELDGDTVSAQTGRTFTALPDYMAENHGMVHPSYTASALQFLCRQATLYALHGRPLPDQALHNRQHVYDQLKRTTDSTGSLHPVQGMDWPYLFPDPGTGCHGAAAAVLRDADAANLERRALATLEARQQSHGGRMYDEELATTVHGPQDPLIIRECAIAAPATTYLLHRALGDGPRPTADAQLEKRLRGVKVYPHSGFAFHRHGRGQTSLAWRNSIMALPLGRDGQYTVAPASDSWLAHIQVKGQPERHDLVAAEVEARADAFAAALVLERAQGTVRQEVLFASLPSGVSLSWERLSATCAVTVESVEQGFLRIVNEDYPGLAGNCNGARTLFTPAGRERFAGFASPDPASDVERQYRHPGWLNVDGRLGLAYRGTGLTHYTNRHHFPVWRAVADDLILSREEAPGRVRAGATIGQLAAAIAPGYSSARTAALHLVEPRCPRHSAALLLGDHLALANFSDRSRTVTARVPRVEGDGVPVFAGLTTITAERVTHAVGLPPWRPALRRALCEVETTGEVEIVAAAEGRVLARNTSSTRTRVQVAGGPAVHLRPGASAVLR